MTFHPIPNVGEENVWKEAVKELRGKPIAGHTAVAGDKSLFGVDAECRLPHQADKRQALPALFSSSTECSTEAYL